MGFYEYLITEVKLNKRDINSDINDYIDDYLDKLHPVFQKMFAQFQNDIIRLRPDVGATIKNWWGGIKKFGNDVWTGKYNTGKYVDHQVYNAKLYNLVETYATALCNESNVNNIDDLLNQFYKKLTSIMREGMKRIAQHAIENGYELGYSSARKSTSKSSEPSEPSEPSPSEPDPSPPISTGPRPYVPFSSQSTPTVKSTKSTVKPTVVPNFTSSFSTLD